MAVCRQEKCPNWAGDGKTCICALAGLVPDDASPQGYWDDDDYE